MKKIHTVVVDADHVATITTDPRQTYPVTLELFYQHPVVAYSDEFTPDVGMQLALGIIAACQELDPTLALPVQRGQLLALDRTQLRLNGTRGGRRVWVKKQARAGGRR